MSTKTMAEACAEVEGMLTKEESARAMARGRELGWEGSAPAFVWYYIFNEVLARREKKQ